MPSPRVTVVVPTRARPEPLSRCIEALSRQSLGGALEIVVVHDGEDGPDLGATVARFAGVRLIVQRRAGPGAARNRGAAAARAPVLCFTDDDCEPAVEWAEELERAVTNGVPAAIGRTVNGRPDSRLASASQLVVDHLTDRSLDSPERASYGAANNFAVRADVFRSVQFDPRFRFAGGDRDWCERLRAAGHELAYAPSAIVSHQQRLTPQSFLRQQFAYGRGAYSYRAQHGSPLRLEPSGFYAALISRAFKADPGVAALVAFSQLATAAGYVTEALKPTLLSGRRLRRPPLRRSSRASASDASRSSPS